MGLRLVAFAFLWLAQACASTGGGDRILYYKVKVQRGESLAQIAARFDTTWQSIAKDNGLRTPKDARVGMMLKVRPGPGGYLAGSEVMERENIDPSPRKRGGLLFDGGSASNMAWPVRGKINSPYGMRNGRMHDGIDIDGETGDKVTAAAKGIVKVAERTSGYGKTVIISHGDYSTLYAHLSSIDVNEGDVVSKGDTVGEVGESGHATGPHLHFEVRNSQNKPQNPMSFLERRSSLYSSR